MTSGPNLERQMSISHGEFMRSLPSAAPGLTLEVANGVIRLSDPPRLVCIELGPEEEFTLGSLVLPRTRVRLAFEGFSEEARRAFLDRFDLAYRRGGG